jgi:hypothetical protein
LKRLSGISYGAVDRALLNLVHRRLIAPVTLAGDRVVYRLVLPDASAAKER